MDRHDAEDCLLWISSQRTCSALHFDLCQGFLCQLGGTKRVLLFPFDIEKYDHFYQFTAGSAHQRQSMIDDIHRPDADKFEKFAADDTLVCHQGVIGPDEGLYIPFAWWHQIESDAQSGSISLSFRWNPYLQTVKEAMLTASKMDNAWIGDLIVEECIAATPFYVRQVEKKQQSNVAQMMRR